MKAVGTPGFGAENVLCQRAFIGQVHNLIGGRGLEPSWVVGDPNATEAVLEDGGSTHRIPYDGTKKVYAIRDDYPDMELLTFLMASEY